jgi:hypothetical protein
VVAATGGVPTSRIIAAGAGLAGGGDLSLDRTIDVGAGTGIVVAADAVSVTLAPFTTGDLAEGTNLYYTDARVTANPTVTAKADTSYVDTQDATKAATTYVDAQDALKVAKAGDTMTGLLVLSGDPTAALDAATKQYVDNAIAAAKTGRAFQ